MRIAIASDHAAFALKAVLVAWLRERGHDVTDLGPTTPTHASIIPIMATRSPSAIAAGEAERGIALCGSGIGISIAVNRNPRCRCALVSEPLSAALAREHNDANVIAMGARLIGDRHGQGLPHRLPLHRFRRRPPRSAASTSSATRSRKGTRMSTNPARSTTSSPTASSRAASPRPIPRCSPASRHELEREQTPDRADRAARTSSPRRCSRRRARSSPTNMPKAIRASAIIRAAHPSDEVETAGDRARQAAVRLRLRQRPAAFGRAGQWRGDAGADQARRHDHGPEPRCRRPSDPRREARRCRGKWFNAVQYGVDPDDASDRFRPGRARWRASISPKLIIAGGSAYPRQIDFARFRAIADEVGALLHGRHGAFRRARRRRRCTPSPLATPMSSPPRRTRRCAARAAAWS